MANKYINAFTGGALLLMLIGVLSPFDALLAFTISYIAADSLQKV